MTDTYYFDKNWTPCERDDADVTFFVQPLDEKGIEVWGIVPR